MKRRALLSVVMLASACASHPPPRPPSVAATPPPAVAEAPLDLPLDPRPEEQPVLALDEDPPYFALVDSHPQLKGAARLARATRLDTPLEGLSSSKALPASDVARGRYTLSMRDGGYRLVLSSDLLAEVEIDGVRAYTWSKLGASNDLTLARVGTPSGSIECGKKGLPTRPGMVRGIRMSGWSEGAVTFDELTTEYDQATCQGRATSGHEVVAHAIWPGVLYAFVTDEDDATSTGQFSVIGPPTLWLASEPASPKEQLRPHVGSFSLATVSLDHPTASIALTLSEDELATFESIRRGRGVPKRRRHDDKSTGDVPSVRVLIEIERSTEGGGVVRTTIEPLVKSPVVEAAVARAKNRRVEAERAEPAPSRTVSAIGVGGAVGALPAPRADVLRTIGCRCQPSDSLCECL